MSKPAQKKKADREARLQKKRLEKRRKREARRVGGLVPREEEVRPVHVRILVVCEGERTEPNYFESFPIRSGSVVRVLGRGMNTITLVREAVRLRDDDGEYDETWVVFDRDSFPAEDFHDAILFAERNGMGAAYTNEAFELWYLLHFDYCDTAHDRQVYGGRLSGYLKRRYAKNDASMYQTLLPMQQAAIRNADRLAIHHENTPPADANPSTTVQRLVRRLNELLRP